MKFKKSKKTIFLDPQTDVFVSDEILDIILSPSLYWVKKVTLPLKHARDAKRLLPSLFEDILPDGIYSYSVYKDDTQENSFYIFAYEDKTILELFSKNAILLSNVASIHFAQTELNNITGAVKINEMQSIYVKDGVVTLVPCCWIEESGDLDLRDTKLSKHTITLSQFGHIVDNKSLMRIGVILSIFIVLTLVELFIVKQDIKTIQNDSSKLFVKYHLKPTMFQNKALLKKYKTLHKNQTKLREEFKKALKQKDIKKITYKNNILKVSS